MTGTWDDPEPLHAEWAGTSAETIRPVVDGVEYTFLAGLETRVSAAARDALADVAGIEWRKL